MPCRHCSMVTLGRGTFGASAPAAPDPADAAPSAAPGDTAAREAEPAAGRDPAATATTTAARPPA
jgi:hypothetical protein